MSKRVLESSNTTPSQIHRDQQESINRSFDQTRNNIKKTINEVEKDISDYAEQLTNLQETAIEATRDIADNYLESQKEMYNSFNQSIWTPYVEYLANANRTSAFPGMCSQSKAEVYGNTLTTMFDNFVTAGRLANKTVFANAELINTSFQQARNNVREFSRIGVTAARNIHQASNELATIGISTVQSMPPVGKDSN
jgi:septal ring factor EnvC (AmiA/AmiB activator)